ncbi:MAG TPA: sulfite exporter TauE/SafE family protein [Terriglobia bacterium]|nr:sulfite exporter TauE/SafE family protein [Terriglobia bacterium]
MNDTIFAVFGIGFVLGIRHALEPDHLVAVSTIVGSGKSIGRSSIIGTLWGLGHTASLLICGALVLALRLSIREDFVAWMERAVAVMLVALGINTVWKLARDWKLHIHVHSHGGPPHLHFHVHDATGKQSHDHRHGLDIPFRSFFIGMLHGLAGSGALMVLVLATVRSFISGLIYILLFGLGSVGGMLLLSTLISIPFALSARRYRLLNCGMQLVAGLMSIALGIFWIS